MDKGKVGAICNIGGNNEKANIEIVRLILRELGKPESLIQHVQDRPGHDRRYAVDSTKITAELGWFPTHSFEEGIAETIQRYVENREWTERVASTAFGQ